MFQEATVFSTGNLDPVGGLKGFVVWHRHGGEYEKMSSRERRKVGWDPMRFVPSPWTTYISSGSLDARAILDWLGLSLRRPSPPKPAPMLHVLSPFVKTFLS